VLLNIVCKVQIAVLKISDSEDQQSFNDMWAIRIKIRKCTREKKI